jgi:hypothetical protein
MITRILLTSLLVSILILTGSFHSGQAVREVGDFDRSSAELQTAASTGPFGGSPAYDSGWLSIAQNEIKTLNHNLGGNPDNYVVSLEALNVGNIVNQLKYGGDTNQSNSASLKEFYGFAWQALTNNSIQVIRFKDDTVVYRVRVRIWVVSQVDYDSGWQSIDPSETLTLKHSLGGMADDYVVDMQFKTGGTFGVHNRSYGIDTHYDKTGSGYDYKEWGANWHSLNNHSITVYRGKDELYVNSVRIRIWRIQDSDYDSGWQDISMGINEMRVHPVGGPWNDYYVYLQFKNDGIFEIHQINYGNDTNYLGGNYFTKGAWLSGIQNDRVYVWRGADDAVVDKYRVRVWANPVPKYDSGWKAIARGELKTFYHDLGGEPDNYVVDLQFKDTLADGSSSRGVSQMSYGGDSHKGFPSGDIKSDGVYWRELSGSQIKVYSYADDAFTDEVRVRIWIPPTPSYNSGWTSISPDGFEHDFTHAVGGDPDEYVVDMQFKDSAALGAGINQQGYGWNYYRAGASSEVWTGAAWSHLNNNSVSVTRALKDTAAEEVRIRIWKNPKPDYDSKWTLIDNAVTKNFSHNLGGNPDDYVLDLQFLDDIYYDVNQIYYGGNLSYEMDGSTFREGTFWSKLNSTTVNLLRQKNDSFADNVRLRIWKTGSAPSNYSYLPLVVKDK